MAHQTALLALFTLHFLTSGVVSTTFIFSNKCDYTVWPGLLSNAGVAPLPTTGFELSSGDSKSISAPSSWAGRFWGRTHCAQDSAGKFTCATADCGSGTVECSGAGAKPPATLAEITLDGHGGMDFYDVSLVDGYNVAMAFVPGPGGVGPNCTATGCVADLNGACPSELRVVLESSASGEGVACRSACEAFRESQYCCDGANGTPDTCGPTVYSRIFKSACPRAYSYAYDDHSSTFTCSAVDSYTITFCPSPSTSQKASQDGQNTLATGSTTSPRVINGTMVYEGALDVSSGSRSTCRKIIGLIGFTAAIWPLMKFML